MPFLVLGHYIFNDTGQKKKFLEDKMIIYINCSE